MSFKRDGDDSCQLNLLKKRRVADLLASYIPEDEALLLKNGRYACTVCHHRPVFDTIDMLSVHRNGKKHIACLQRYYSKKTEHNNEIQKRQHQAYVQAEEAGEKPPSQPAPLLTQTRKITQHALLKSAPYDSRCSHHRSSDRSGISRSKDASSWAGPSSDAGVDLLPGGQSVRATGKESSAPHTMGEPANPGHSSGSSTDTCKRNTHRGKNSSRHKNKSNACPEKSNADPDRERAMQHYLLLRSSGWIPDGTGKWVKDENVEFDSDEEEPPALPSS
ncbi:sodium channel modifier 1-like [Rhinophrynus dorsalis]